MSKDTDSLDTRTRKQINDMVNSVECITYYKHHYIRKTGLKRLIKNFVAERDRAVLQTVLEQMPIPARDWKNLDQKQGYYHALTEVKDLIRRIQNG